MDDSEIMDVGSFLNFNMKEENVPSNTENGNNGEDLQMSNLNNLLQSGSNSLSVLELTASINRAKAAFALACINQEDGPLDDFQLQPTVEQDETTHSLTEEQLVLLKNSELLIFNICLYQCFAQKLEALEYKYFYL